MHLQKFEYREKVTFCHSCQKVKIRVIKQNYILQAFISGNFDNYGLQIL